jgi:hypothetical protein
MNGFPEMDECLLRKSLDLVSRDLRIVTDGPDGQSGFVIALSIKALPP